MPNYTKNKKYATFQESEKVDVSLINGNFIIDDGFPYIVEAGKAVANRYSPNSTSSVAEKIDWYYKKYSDGTMEAYAVAHVTAMVCNDSEKEDGTWRSKFFRFQYPSSLGIKKVYHRSAWLSGADDGTSGYWLEDVSSPGDGQDNATYQTVRGVSTKKETKARDKNIYVGFKATWK